MVGMGGFTAGLNNRADDTAGPKNEAGAPIALRGAVNVSLHNDGSPFRRPGQTQRVTGRAHSLFAFHDWLLSVVDGELRGYRQAHDGAPNYWVPDYHEGRLYLDRPVDKESVLHLNVWRTPLESEAMTDNDDTLAIAAHWHENLLDWAAHLAFSMIDADTRNEELAMEYARRFDAKVGRLPTMTEIRLWGVSPIVGGQAEFV